MRRTELTHEGAPVFVRQLTARQMAGLIDSGMDDMHGLIRLAQLSAVTEAGEPIWPDEATAGEAPWTMVKAVADAAMQVNGLEDAGPGNA